MRRQYRAPFAVTAITFVALLGAAGAAQAQVGWSIGGGPSLPQGVLDEFAGTGYNAQVSGTLSVPLIPIGVRIDGAFNQFPVDGENGDFRVISGSVNGVLSLPSVLVTPYVIGGVGYYNSSYTDDEVADSESTSDVGANIGAGVRVGLGGLAVFGEARLHHIFSEGDALRFVPITVGLRF